MCHPTERTSDSCGLSQEAEHTVKTDTNPDRPVREQLQIQLSKIALSELYLQGSDQQRCAQRIAGKARGPVRAETYACPGLPVRRGVRHSDHLGGSVVGIERGERGEFA